MMREEASHSSVEESKGNVANRKPGIPLSDKKGSIKSCRITNKLLIESKDSGSIKFHPVKKEMPSPIADEGEDVEAVEIKKGKKKKNKRAKAVKLRPCDAYFQWIIMSCEGTKEYEEKQTQNKKKKKKQKKQEDKPKEPEPEVKTIEIIKPQP